MRHEPGSRTVPVCAALYRFMPRKSKKLRFLVKKLINSFENWLARHVPVHAATSNIIRPGKTEHAGPTKKRKREQSSKTNPGPYEDLVQKAKNLEEEAGEAVARAKTRKKIRGAKAALAVASATRRLLESYNK